MIFTNFLFAGLVAGQIAGPAPEVAPSLTYETCDTTGCTGVPSKVVLDANWRWFHESNGFTNCFGGDNEWLCQVSMGAQGCNNNCVLEGISATEYRETYGIHTRQSELVIDYVTHGEHGVNYGARTYLMENDTSNRYKMVKFAGPDSYQEFSFDVDVSAIPCGLNGALYLSEMNPNGSADNTSGNNNAAGAEYGTGYCDAQCFRDIKYINGQVNLPVSGSTGNGQYGACCMEMDIWEANSQSQALTPHNCARLNNDDNADPVIACESAEQCGDGDLRFQGVCDKNGCDLNPFRFAQGDQTLENFYGPGDTFRVNTNLPMTVVTQFVQDANQDVTEIRRLYVQNGEVIGQPQITVVDPRDGQTHRFDSISDNMCDVTKAWMNEVDSQGNRVNHWETLGGMTQMNKAFRKGMVLVMSLWDDTSDARMQWLDAVYPENSTNNGDHRGRCAAPGVDYYWDTRLMYGPDASRTVNGRTIADTQERSGVSGYQYPAKAAFSNIRFGTTLGSTFDGPVPAPAPPAPLTPGYQQWKDQCGGEFGNCADLDNLVCVSSGSFSECRKANASVTLPQRTEKCAQVTTDGQQECGVGLRCNPADRHCERDETYVAPSPPTTPAPPAPTTAAPTTAAPTTQAPTTQAPTTQAPTTQAPTTQAPTTQAPTTQAPTTQAPTTQAPTTQAPTTQAPPTTCSGSWQQCGGANWTGPTCCQNGWSCVANGPWYSQCLNQRLLAENVLNTSSEVMV